MGIYRAACAVIGFAFGGAEKLRIKSSKVWIGDTCNANQGAGITINQLDLDNEILAFKSSDVAHCISGVAENDTYGEFKKAAAAGGGLQITGLSETSNIPMLFQAHSKVMVDCSNGTSATGMFTFNTNEDNGAMTNCANIVVFREGGNTRFIFDGEGDAYADVQFTTFDDYNDIELLRGVHGVLVPCYKERFGQDMMYNLCHYTNMKLIGKDSVHWEEQPCGKMEHRGMINFTSLAMLHHSTIIQMYDQLTTRLDGLETQLKSLSGGE